MSESEVISEDIITIMSVSLHLNRQETIETRQL